MHMRVLVYKLVRKILKIICQLLMIITQEGIVGNVLLVRFEVFIKSMYYSIKQSS